MSHPVEDLRIETSKVLLPPAFLEEELPATDSALHTVRTPTSSKARCAGSPNMWTSKNCTWRTPSPTSPARSAGYCWRWAPAWWGSSAFLGAVLLTSPVAQGQGTGAWQDPSVHNVHFVTVEDGVRLEVLDWGGQGGPVVLLAGLGFTAHVFDGFAEKLSESSHVYGITRRGYGASSQPAFGYTEERLAEDDLRAFDALKLTAPIVIGHSVAGDELSQLGIHHHERIGGLVYLDALNDGSDDWTELSAKLPEAIKKPPLASSSDLKSFLAYRDWRMRTEGVAYPEAELRNDFAENPDGSVGGRMTPGFVPQAIMSGNYKHDYSQIRVLVLAFVGYPPLPQDEIRRNDVTDTEERTIIEAVFGVNVGLIRNRIKRINSAAGGARVIELWGASHFVFLSNESDVLREIRIFLAGLH